MKQAMKDKIKHDMIDDMKHVMLDDMKQAMNDAMQHGMRDDMKRQLRTARPHQLDAVYEPCYAHNGSGTHSVQFLNGPRICSAIPICKQIGLTFPDI